MAGFNSLLSYRQIKDQQAGRAAADPNDFLGQTDTGTFSKLMQLLGDGSQNYQQGVNANWVKDASVGIERGLEATGLPQLAGDAIGGLGAGVDSLRGTTDQKYEQLGQNVGKAIPRGLADTGLVLGGIAGAPFTGGASLALTAAGVADAGISGYTDTDSVGQGLLQAGMTLAAPGIGKVGGAIGTRLLPKALAGNALAQFAAAEVGSEAAFAVSGGAEQALRGQNPFSGESLFENLAGSVAFAPVTIAQGIGAVRRMPKAVGDPTLPQTTDLIQRPGVVEGGKGSQYVDANNSTRLFNYLIGHEDYTIEKTLATGDLGNALRMSGLDIPVHQDSAPETLARREKGKELVNRGANSEDPAQQEALVRKGAALLQTTPNNLVDFIKIVQARNEFTSKLPKPIAGLLENAPNDNTGLINVPQPKGPFDVDTGGSNYSRKPKAVEPTPVERDPNTIALRSEEWEAQSAGQRETQRAVEASKPKTSTGEERSKGRLKPSALEDRMGKPEYSGAVPDWLSDDLAQREANGWKKEWPFVPVDLVNPSFREAIAKDPSLPQAEKDLILSFGPGGKREIKFSVAKPGADKNGEFTAGSLKAEYDNLLKLEGDPDRAMMRLGLIMQNGLREDLQNAVPNTYFAHTAERQLDQQIGRMGLDPMWAGLFKDTALKVASNLDVDPRTAVTNFTDPTIRSLVEQDNGVNLSSVAGVFVNEPKGGAGRIGIQNPDWSQQMLNPMAQAANLGRTLTHETIHGVVDRLRQTPELANGIDGFRHEAYAGALAYAHMLSPEERGNMLLDLQRVVGGARDKGADVAMARYVMNSADEFVTEYAAEVAYRTATADSPTLAKIREFVSMLPEDLQKLVMSLSRTVMEIGELVKGQLTSKGWSDDRLKEFDMFHKNISDLIKPIDKVEKAKQKVVSATKPLDIFQSDAGGAEVKWSKVGIKAMDDRQQEIAKAGTIQRNVANHQQMASSVLYREKIPAYQKAISILTSLPGAVQSLHHSMRLDRMIRVDGGFLRELSSIRDKKLTPEQIRQKSNYAKVGSSQRLTKATSDLMRETNILVQEAAIAGQPFPTWDHPRLRAIWKDLAPDDAEAVRLVYQADMDGNKVAAGAQIKARHEEIMYDLSGIFLSSGLKHSEAEQAGRTLLNSLLQSQGVPPELANIPGVEKAVRHYQAVEVPLAEFEQSMNRPYFNESRTGRYLIGYEVRTEANGEKVTGARSADSVQERDAVLKDLNAKGYKVYKVEDRHNKEYSDFDSVPTYMLERAAALEQARYNSAIDNMDPEMAAQVRDAYVGGEAILAEIANRKGTKNERQFKPGREMINMVNAQQAYVEIISNTAAKQMARAKFRWQMKHEDWQQDTRLRSEVQEFGHNVLAQGRQQFQTFRKAVIGTAMGANISSAFVDASQPITMGLHRAAEHVGLGKAAKFVGEGYIESFMDKDKEFHDILVQADTKGLLTTGSRLEDFVSTDDLASYNVARAGGQRDLVDLEGALTSREFMAGKVLDMVKSLGNKVFNVSMLPMSLSAQINNKTMLYVGYRVGKEKGLKGSALYDFAENMMQVSNIQGARAAQSSFKLKAGKWNEAVSAASILTNYPIAAFSQMYGSYKGMLKSSGLSAQAREASAKAFASQVLTQFAFAGTMGFGLDALFTLVREKLGYDPEEEIRQGLASIDESGFLADTILHGAMNQLTGVDLASRFSLSGVAGFNGYTGFDAKGLFGAAGSFWTNVGALPQNIAEKQPLDQWGILPSGFKKILSSIQGGPIRDKNGQTLIEPSEAERMQYFMGFRPKRLSDVQDQRSAQQSAKDLVQRENKMRLRNRMDLLDKGDYAGALTDIKTEVEDFGRQLQESGVTGKTLQKELDRRTRQLTLNLVEQKVNKDLPLDPMADQGSSQVAAGFGDRLIPRAAQVARQQAAGQLLQNLGQQAVRRTPQAVQLARAVDALMQQSPTMTRQEAELLIRSQSGM